MRTCLGNCTLRPRSLSGSTPSLPTCKPALGAHSQLLATTTFTLRVRGLCSTQFSLRGGAPRQPPTLGPTSARLQPPSRGAGRAASPRGAVRHHVRGPQLNAPATPPTATFGGPASTLAGPLLTLSGSDESKAPQLPMAAAPGEASSHRAADGEGSPRAKASPLFDILDAGKGAKGSAHKGCWDRSLDAPPTAVT